MWQQQLKLNGNFIGMQLVGLSMQHGDIIFQRCVSETKTFRTLEMLFSTFTLCFFLSVFCFGSWQCLWHVRAVLVISALFGQRETRGGAWTCIILIKRASFCRCRRCHDENIIKVYDIYLLPTLNDTCVSLSERLKLSDSHPCSLPPSPPPFSLSHCGH